MIVVDAGHGGSEEGAKGPGGALEKNVTLSVARRLKAALEARLGVRVILTRDGDQTMALDERAALANNNKADLFVSLHANASLRPGMTGAEVFYLSLDEYGDAGERVARGESEPLPVFGGGTRDIEVILVGHGAGALHPGIRGARPGRRSVASGAGTHEPARDSAGAVPRARRRQHAGRAGGDGLHHERRPRRDSCNPTSSRISSCRDSWRASAIPRRAQRRAPERGAVMVRRMALGAAVVVAALAGAWMVVSWRRAGCAPRRHRRRPSCRAPRQRPLSGKSRPHSYYVSEDGLSLPGVQREIPFGDPIVEQARRIVEAQLASAPRRIVSPVPAGTSLRALFIGERGDAFVDLSGEVRGKHPGGALDELFTVYAVVNAITVNLPAIMRVQILIDGKEADTLAGHVDLRRPLRKNLSWTALQNG